MTNQCILITGGAGFIGSRLVGRLVWDNEIIVIDNMSRDALSNTPWRKHPNLSIIGSSVLNERVMHKNIAERNIDYIVHCAAIAGIGTVGKRPTETMRVNIVGTLNVLDNALYQKNIKRIVCFSTSEVFGPMAFTAREIDHSVIGASGEARWTYAASKLAIEHMAFAFHREHGLPVTVVRPFNVYGPGQVGDSAMKTFIQQALRNEPLTIHGAGTQIRAWCFIDDMVDAILLCMEKDEAIGESFNVGNERSVVTIWELAKTVVRVFDSKSEICYGPKPSADIQLRIPCADKARDVLGFEAKVDLEEGIRRTAEYYREDHL